MKRMVLALVALSLLLAHGVATANPPGVGLSLTGPAQFDAGVPVSFSGRLDVVGAAGLPLQIVEILVDGVPSGAAQTAIDGTYQIAITFGPAPASRTVQAFAHRGTPLESSSAPLTLTVRPYVVSVSVGPVNASVVVGQQISFTALAQFSDGSLQDVTTAATWSSADPGIVSVSDASGSKGVATGQSAGTTTISASYQSNTGSTQITATTPSALALVINEVDYDQQGTDSQEFIELYNPTSATISLDGVAVVLVNGANSLEYARVTLSGTLIPGGYVVVASPFVTVPGGVLVFNFSASTNAIQNGAPDGVALFDTVNNVLIDALSYEGSITAATISGAPGTYNLVEGTATSAADVDAIVGSLSRTPNGSDTNDAATDWQFVTPTPGSANV